MEQEPTTPPKRQQPSDRLAAVRTIVIGSVLMWIVLVIAWAANKGFDLYADAERERDVKAARLRLAGVDELQGVFNEVNGAVEPAVVKIDVVRERGPQPQQRTNNLPDDQNFEANSGSGVVVEVHNDARRPYAYVVTNEHVVRNPDSVFVTIPDGSIVEARVVGTDPQSDLAVLRLPADGLVAAEWGDSNALRKGDWVLAFGSPFGFVGSMTAGIVSALNRTQTDAMFSPSPETAYQDFIQVDAAINPGNSGGPLVDITGRVVGINTAIFTRTGDFSGIGFAIPSNQARRVFEDIRDDGRVVRGYVGITGRAVREIPGGAELLKLPTDEGVFVERVYRDTPAAEAGLQRGDIIVTIDGEPVDDFIRFRTRAGLSRPGDTITMGVFRDGEEVVMPLVVGERPAGQLTLNLTPQETDPFGLELSDAPDGGPPIVTLVDPEGVAWRAGLREGDRIYSVAGRPIADAELAKRAIAAPPPQLGVEVRVLSGDRVVNLFLRAE